MFHRMGELLEEVNKFKYLGAQIARRGGVEDDVSWRVGEARKATGTVKKNCGRMVAWECKIRRCFM